MSAAWFYYTHTGRRRDKGEKLASKLKGAICFYPQAHSPAPSYHNQDVVTTLYIYIYAEIFPLLCA